MSVAKRGPGRPPGSGKVGRPRKNGVTGAVGSGVGSVEPRRRLVGKVRRWTRRWTSEGHLDVLRWAPVEGSEQLRRFEETGVRGGEEESLEEEEEETLAARRARMARVRSGGERGEGGEGGGGERGGGGGERGERGGERGEGGERGAAREQPVVVNLVRYRCPVPGCGQIFFKVAGLLAHTRMKHKLRKEKVDVQGCKFTLDPNAPPEVGMVGEEEAHEEEEEQHSNLSASFITPAAEAEPQVKKLKLVIKRPIQP